MTLLMVKRLLIAQLNSSHSVAVSDLVEQVLLKEKNDISLLQEPPLVLERKISILVDYKIYLKCGDLLLTAILVHSHLCTTSVDFLGDRLFGSSYK